MPIEIRELHIKVAVTGGGPGAGAGAAAQPPGAADGAGEQAQQALVAECVEQVLRILQNKMER
ncbi:DUF5908 family protein [Rugamonas sp. DEMB1]|uniref:DUF5908 family protein n=1 Tax=Rugamonas sp. DEMB1 TaxID=3039386 RepID=UPI002449E5BC|nr:DUF5908 family protein [Rugamonas sp. DEMB1]WGG48145.1 DUF5908 family protein [Rugamonas sp. DEMB1]